MASSTPSKDQLYDPIRKKWVAATPEEKVRQSLLHTMTHELLFPKELVSIEKKLSEMPHLALSSLDSIPDRRVDILCFGKGIHPHHLLYPLLAIECKESKTLATQAMEQVIGYNYHLKSYFVAVSYPGGVEWGYLDKVTGRYQFFPFLPSYPELIKSLSYANS